jgi:hypothetical protein
MLIIGVVLILLYFIAQALEVAAGALSIVARYSEVLFFVSAVALSVAAFFISKKSSKLKSNNKTALVIGHLLLYGTIFVSYGKFETHYADMGTSIFGTTFNVSFLNTAFVFIIAIISAFFIPAAISAPFTQKYLEKKYLISLGFISAYAAFAAIGDSLFFQYDFSPVTLTVYLLGVLWIFPMTLQVLALYEIIASRMQKASPVKTRSKHFVWLTSFGVFTAVWLVYLIAYNPAQMSPDSMGMWHHATSGERIGYLGFPTLIIFMVRLLTYIIPHPMFIAIVQIVLFSALCSFFMLEFYKRGISLRVIYIFAGVFAALPPNGLMITTLWSNIPYTLSMLYLTYAIFKILSPDKGKIIPYINVTLALALTYSTRHEGLVPAILCVILFLFLSLKKPVNLKLLSAAAVGCLLIVLTQGPLYKAITAEDERNLGAWYVLVDGLHSVVYHDGELPEETRIFMESLLPLDVWKTGYSVYDIWSGMSREHKTVLLENVSGREGLMSEAFEHYLITFKREPLILIRNRVANSNLVWGVTQPKGSFNERCMTWTSSGNIGFPHRKNFIETLITRVVYPATSLAPLDVMLYRSGVYIILVLVLLVFLSSHNRFKVCILFMPMLGGIIALLLAMGWTVFRNIWFIPVICIFIVPLLLLQEKTDN